ncbi:MAG: alkaline phosphatase family protein [Acidimicrobiales bacterium]
MRRNAGTGDIPDARDEIGGESSEARLSRRKILEIGAYGALGLAGGSVLAGCATSTTRKATTRSSQPSRLRSSHPVLEAGHLPYPNLKPGTDTMPKIEHIVVLMEENRSFDHLLGMLGRGNGFRLDSRGLPTATNPYHSGELIRAFPDPNPCRTFAQPVQSWYDSHFQYDRGTNQGFARSRSGPAAMGYYTGTTIPFTYGLARTFPIGDNYFCSLMGPTFPNRRYLLSGTSSGLIKDTLTAPHPAHGTIMEMLNAHGISWRDYYSDLPSTDLFFYLAGQPTIKENVVPIAQFYADAKAGTLPSFSLIDPQFLKKGSTEGNSEGEGQDIQYGDAFIARVVDAVMTGPGWSKTALVITYDEHGGYFDHVPPPSAVPPDNIAPDAPQDEQYDGFARYGFRVPTIVVSPYAKPDYVSHMVYDHTSILKLVETKWNLPALTARDANAANMLDFLDLHHAAFATPPVLPSPLNPALLDSCLTSGLGGTPSPGKIPPSTAIIKK